MRRPHARGTRASRRVTIAAEMARAVAQLADRLESGQWPAVAWQRDPVGFWTRLGVEFLDHQIEIMNSVRDNPRTAVSSGQKIGKTFTVACLIWWFYCCFPKARVTVTATTGTQVDNVIWDELKNVYRLALAGGVDLLAGGGKMAEDFHSGVESLDGRSIRGLTVQQIEAMGGISGEHQLFVADEASSLSEALGHAIIGNTAAGNKILWTSNPTRAEGPFFDAFHRQKPFWKTFELSSADIANKAAASGRRVPGVASKSTIDEWREMFGERSIFWLVRVLGKFVTNESGKIVSMHRLALAQKLWNATAQEEPSGVLSLGVDVAGEGEDGDDWGFCARKGSRVLELRAVPALTQGQAKTVIREMLARHRRGSETPRVVIDATGKLGSEFLGAMRAIAAQLIVHKPSAAFEVFGLHAHRPAQREPMNYDRVRDELWAGVAQWIEQGGAIPPDFFLEAELHAASWSLLINGKRKATDKRELRRILGRSTDRADALALSLWEPGAWSPEIPRSAERGPVTDTHDAGAELDVYDGASWAWEGRRAA